jgi:hypothetical protein
MLSESCAAAATAAGALRDMKSFKTLLQRTVEVRARACASRWTPRCTLQSLRVNRSAPCELQQHQQQYGLQFDVQAEIDKCCERRCSSRR